MFQTTNRIPALQIRQAHWAKLLCVALLVPSLLLVFGRLRDMLGHAHRY